MVEASEALQHGALQRRAQRPDQQGDQDQRQPVIDIQHIQQEIGAEGAHHVEGAMGEIDDVQHAENDREPEAQQGVEGPVDQAHQ